MLGKLSDAVLAGLIMIISFAISDSDVQVEGLHWVEPVLVFVAVCMPTGSASLLYVNFFGIWFILSVLKMMDRHGYHMTSPLRSLGS